MYFASMERKFSGKIDTDAEYSVTVIAENELGRDEKEILLSAAFFRCVSNKRTCKTGNSENNTEAHCQMVRI